MQLLEDGGFIMQDFKKKLTDMLLERLGSDRYSIKETEMVKNNDLKLHSLCVVEEGEVFGANIYVEEAFKIYQELTATSKNPWDELIDILMSRLVRSSEEDRMLPAMVLEAISNYDYMQDKIIFRIVNRNNNTQYLKDKVYLPFFNFAICFYVLANEPQEDGTVGSIALTKGLVEKWGMSLDEMLEIAKKNMQRLFPPKIENVYQMIKKMLDENDFIKFINSPLPSENMQNHYVLSNNIGVNGAVTICYDSVLKEFSKEHGEADIYIVPCSIHSVMIVPADKCTDEEIQQLQETIQELNQKFLETEEMLDADILYYQQAEDKLIAYEKRKEKKD